MTESQYQQECDKAFAEEEFIGNRVAWYMRDGGSCDPYTPEVFTEALAYADEELINSLSPLLKKTRINFEEVGKAIVCWVNDNLVKQATRMAEDDLERDKEYCNDI